MPSNDKRDNDIWCKRPSFTRSFSLEESKPRRTSTKGPHTHNPTENKPDTWRLATPSPHEPSNLNNLSHHQPAYRDTYTYYCMNVVKSPWFNSTPTCWHTSRQPASAAWWDTMKTINTINAQRICGLIKLVLKKSKKKNQRYCFVHLPMRCTDCPQ